MEQHNLFRIEDLIKGLEKQKAIQHKRATAKKKKRRVKKEDGDWGEGSDGRTENMTLADQSTYMYMPP